MIVKQKSVKIAIVVTMTAFIAVMSLLLTLGESGFSDHGAVVIGMILLAIGASQQQYDLILAIDKWSVIYEEWRKNGGTWRQLWDRLKGAV